MKSCNTYNIRRALYDYKKFGHKTLKRLESLAYVAKPHMTVYLYNNHIKVDLYMDM